MLVNRRAAIIDPQRIIRPGRTIQWHVSLKTRMLFRDLLNELLELEQEVASSEVNARMEAIREDIRNLPGYPQRYDPDRDIIEPVTTTAMR